MSFGPLVSTDWLADHVGEPDVTIIDGSWRMPGNGDARDSYNAKHIPGAVFFDIDAIADTSSPLPHMAPIPEAFETAIGAMGVSEDDRVVIYDEKGLFSAARVWWTFRLMGHERVAVLDGGLPKWLAEGRPVTAQTSEPAVAVYHASPQPTICASASDLRSALSEGAIVLDARPADRFAGVAAEPRPGLRSGHMPGARNLPFQQLLTGDGRLQPVETLERLLTEAGAAPGGRVIPSCGSGVTAAIVYLALELVGGRATALYDGSWAEWGDETHDDLLFPVVADA